MRFFNKTIAAGLTLVFCLAVLFPDPCPAMTIGKERELSDEFKKMALSQFQVINEPLIADYVTEVGRKILSVMPPQPFAYRFYVINEKSLNAFAGPGGLIFVHSGLLEIMDSEDELAGILSHEIAHGVHRHLADRAEQWKGASLAALGTIAAGLLLGVTGGGMPVEALALGALSTGQSVALAYSREAEMQADITGVSYMKSAGYSVDGLLSILRKMRSQQWFGPQEIPTYLTTHPALDDRMAYISSQAQTASGGGSKNSIDNQDKFKWPHAKLVAMYGDENTAVRKFEGEVKAHPEDALSHYAYGLALARKHNLEQSEEHLRSALDKAPFNSHILVDLGRIYYEDHQFKEASRILKGAVTVSPNNLEGLYYFGRTQYEIGAYGEAVELFSTISERYEDVPEAFYHLGQSYGKLGNRFKAHYNLGIYYQRIQRFQNALFHFQKAVKETDNQEEKHKIEKMIEEITKEQTKRQERAR